MKKFVVERNLPGAGNLTAEELAAISQTSCEVISKLGRPYHWIQSFVTEDKIYCIHVCESEQIVREHSRLCKFPVNSICEVNVVMDASNSNTAQL